MAAEFFIGLGLGAEVAIMAFLTSRYFGLCAFGAIYGVMFCGLRFGWFMTPDHLMQSRSMFV